MVIIRAQACVSQKTQQFYGPERSVVKLQSARFKKPGFLHLFNARKIKRIAKFDGLEPRPCEHEKGIVTPEKFRDF